MKLREITFLLATSVSLSYGHAALVPTLLEESSRVVLQNPNLRSTTAYERLATCWKVKLSENYHQFLEIRNKYRDMSEIGPCRRRIIQKNGIWHPVSDLANEEWEVVRRNIQELFPGLNKVIFRDAFESLTAYPLIFEDKVQYRAMPLINPFFSILRNVPQNSSLAELLTPFIGRIFGRTWYDIDGKFWTEDKVQDVIKHAEQVVLHASR